MEKLTFKQYVDSKKQLLEAIKETPVHSSTYVIKKYCKLIVGESKDNKESISLKPSNVINVQWLYESVDNPKPLLLTFEGVRGTISDDEYNVYWSGSKLQEWLLKNAVEKINTFK